MVEIPLIYGGLHVRKTTYTLTVNGVPCQVTATPNTILMDVLRDQLRLTGVKDGCATGHCGSCMVIQDGEAVRSCLVLMKRAEGADITTIEGVAGPDGALHPIQQAYIDQGATQCGFCTPGFIMATKALLDKNPNPTPGRNLRQPPVEHLPLHRPQRHPAGHCAGGRPVGAAAAGGQKAAEGHQPAVAAPRCGGQSDRQRHLRRRPVREGMLHARALRSRYTHARLLKVDVAKAQALPGVVAVLTADDIPGRKDCGVHEVDWPVLCYDKVRYVGDCDCAGGRRDRGDRRAGAQADRG